ncbi:uncharacterized protein LOC118826050 [Colossoma macropomum]|uniref:uncharacterized protein LOC118826050 n=1 Tax=Colossoma macropomum TaxID=42526 RepID=UPI00186488F0|nr:uncharacterized protein LOC118826050 [Colossoma macropomum]
MLMKALHTFSVKTGISGLQVQTVRSGNNVVIKCDENIVKDKKTHLLAWYKQRLGNVPEPVLRQFGEGEKLRFASGFKDGRFTVDEEAFDLSIKGIKEEDAATYFCGKVKTNVVEFGSATRLFFQAETIDHRSPTEMVIETGESVTLQCSVQSLTPDCSGEHSVYWFRHGSGESHPGIIYTHGNRSDKCKKSSETDSPTQSCVYKLPKRNLSLSDAGTYYCAVAACGQILFGNQTKVTVQENNSWIVIILTTVSVISSVVIMILLKKQQHGISNGWPSHINQAEDRDVLNYATLNFAKRVKESQNLYSQVEYSCWETTQAQSSRSLYLIMKAVTKAMIRICLTFCLFINVKSSEVAELQVQPVSEGDNVTIKCDQQTAKGNKNGLVWYRQSFGNVPQYVVRTFEHDNKHRFARAFENGRFTMTVDEERFDLNIYGVSRNDIGMYLCGKGKSNVVEFGSGTLLVFEGDCSMYRLKHGSEESNPEINETQGIRNDQCVRISETDSPTQSCVHKLPRRNLSLSDAGTYYCAVVPCEETVFRNGSLEMKGCGDKSCRRCHETSTHTPSTNESCGKQSEPALLMSNQHQLALSKGSMSTLGLRR